MEIAKEASEKAKESINDSAEASSGDELEKAQEKSLEAHDKSKEAMDAMNPYNPEDREAMKEALEDTAQALNEMDGSDPDVQKALDENTQMQEQLQRAETQSENQWGIWNTDTNSWVATNYGEDIIFEVEDEARDWLNARGGMV